MSESHDRDVDRRSLLAAGAGAALASAFAVNAPAAAQHQHGGHGANYTPPKHPALIRTALDCVHTGDLCLHHCYQAFEAGDTSLAVCARRVQELVAACSALARLASLDAKHLAEFAAVTAKICRDCETECRKHAQHKPCTDCGAACAACAKECDKLKA
jgi:Cys-rich four helix bundle protein (predicted Tat secretion target)